MMDDQEWLEEIEESTECIYCSADPVADDVPAVDDDERWGQLAIEHYQGCLWVRSRAFMLADRIESEEQ